MFVSTFVSQAALGESKKGNECVPLFVKFDEKKLVLGTLSPENIPQLSFDLVFEKEFELSHNWKKGSVFFCGYQVIPDDDASGESQHILTICHFLALFFKFC
jgi:nucleophosmin 1